MHISSSLAVLTEIFIKIFITLKKMRGEVSKPVYWNYLYSNLRLETIFMTAIFLGFPESLDVTLETAVDYVRCISL
jgi:hypothetical protein